MKFFQQATRGFTLLEVLISLLILMIALLGIAALMLKGQRAGFEAYQRQQALAMAQEMAEKIRANQGGAPYYVTGVAEGDAMPGHGGLFKTYKTLSDEAKCLRVDKPPCNNEQIADNHLATWDGVLAGLSEIKDAATNRVGGIIGARGCVERPDANQSVFLISVAWQGESDTGIPTASACGAGLYGTAARRRLVTLTVVTCQLNAAAPWGCS